MNFSRAIDSYMLYRQSAGMACRFNEQTIKAFLKMVGDIPLERIRTQQAQRFLDASDAKAGTWRKKHSVLRQFFEHWSWRGEMPFLMLPTMRPAERQTFIPHIYTKPQIRRLLAATKSSQKQKICKADAATLRMFILMLYATGAKYTEILNLQREDIAFKRSRLTLRGTGSRPPRCIPIGSDIKRELQAYLRFKKQSYCRDTPIFLSKAGRPMHRINFSLSFARVRRIAGIDREDASPYSPRLYDLRFTFAVHRITSWIKSGADLNRLIPALSKYMGNVSLETANEYLSLTPERFRKELQKLSPKRGRKRWRDDPALMKFLGSL
jgi:site-specific recombinase XerD